MRNKIIRLLLFVLVCIAPIVPAIPQSTSKPGVHSAQVPFASLKPSVTLKLGATADWVLITDDAVWVASTKPFALWRIDPKTNKAIAKVKLSGEACSGLASGFGSIWVPVCGKKPELVRVDTTKNAISADLAISPAGPEGGITTSDESVWMVTDKKGTLARIDPVANRVRQQISISPGSFNPLFSDGIVWVTGLDGSVLTAVDAISGKILQVTPVGPKPRFLAAGEGSVWTLNQGDGTVSRVDEKSRNLVATIQVGIPGEGGDIDYGAGSVWPTVFDVPLTQIETGTNRVVKQWTGKGGDSLRCGFGSIWITDYKRGLLSRIRFEDVTNVGAGRLR